MFVFVHVRDTVIGLKKAGALAELKMKYVLRDINRNNVIFLLSYNFKSHSINMLLFGHVLGSFENSLLKQEYNVTRIWWDVWLYSMFSTPTEVFWHCCLTVMLLKCPHVYGVSEQCCYWTALAAQSMAVYMKIFLFSFSATVQFLWFVLFSYTFLKKHKRN